MDIILAYPQLQQLIFVKLLFFVFVIFGIIAVYKKVHPVIFLLGFGILSATAYMALVRGTLLSFWGLVGDEITIAAMYESFAYHGLFTDFAYSNLPPFYPSLFFQVIAVIGRFFHWNGVQMAKFGAMITMLCFPVFLYWIQSVYWKHKKDSPKKLVWLLGVLCLFIVIPWNSVITKPYELISGSLTILWTVFLVLDVYQKKINWQRVLVYGITGGILFMLFYFWFALAAMGVALFHLFSKEKTRIKDYAYFLVTGIMVFIVGAPFWLPLVRSYSAHGSENWQLGFFIGEWITTHGPLLSFSLSGIVGLIGLISLIVYRKKIYIRILLSLFVAGYLWQIMGMVTILFFASPLQESKGFMFFNTPILALAAAYGIASYVDYLVKKKKPYCSYRNFGIIGILLLAPTMIFGTFADDIKVKKIYERSLLQKSAIVEILPALKSLEITNPTLDIIPPIVLSTGLPELHAFYPYHDFIYFNQHNSHPAALFSERRAFLVDLAEETDPEVFAQTLKDNPFDQINHFVFLASEEKGYPIIFHRDDFPFGLKEETLWFDKALFDSEYFIEQYRSDKYVIFQLSESSIYKERKI
ncbi:MAG: arabinofuranosyltransferase [Candidatus Magasanikbacteria bacterium]|jgi:hypothetical protein|nr:arabinofuranosyltransferase [Candidatus Magasanikbacteria bacterium]MBT4071268.1 arabinofuranosyltransferase [Candidatus Magasanikbacteria bacterium]